MKPNERTFLRLLGVPRAEHQGRELRFPDRKCVALLAVFWLAVETIGSRRDVIAVLNEGAGAYVARVFAEEEEERAERGADAGGAAPVLCPSSHGTRWSSA